MSVRTPFYEIKLEGEDITPWVRDVTVIEDDRQADSVTITIPDPRMIYTDGLFEGSIVEVDMGYAESGQHALILRATITKIELSYPQDGVPILTLKGEDKSIMMGLVERKKRWRDRTVTDIVRAVARARTYGFARVEAQLNPDPMIRRKPIVQDGQTDLAFLQELAKKYYAKCFVELDEHDKEVLYFVPERRVLTVRRADRLVLRYRMGPNSNLISFSPSFDSSYIERLKEIEDVDHQGNNIRSQEKPPSEIVIWKLNKAQMARANERDRTRIRSLYKKGKRRKEGLQGQLSTRLVVVGEVMPDQSELESTNDALDSRRLGMSASGSTIGNIWLRAKSIVVIKGVSERFNGEWYVSNVTHKIDNNGFKTDFKCVR